MSSPAPRSRTARRGMVGALVLAAAVLAGCGGGKKNDATATTTSLAATTTTIPPPTVAVTPPNGPVNTSFLLVAQGMKVGDQVTFTITFPNNRTFKGSAHTVGQDGTVSAKYLATPGNPTGEYKVHAEGTQGSVADGVFTLDGGAAPPPAGATTTRKRSTGPTTTRKRTTTTAKPPVTTAKPPATTATPPTT